MEKATIEKSSTENLLLFTPYAWAKLKFMCHSVPTEIGGMAITDVNDPLRVVDIKIVKQIVSVAGVSFDDDDLADFMITMCDPDGEYKLQPINCMRIWIHTHPSGMTTPSSLDESTFAGAFGKADWAVMFILARSGEVYARMRSTVGGLTVNTALDIGLAWDTPFPESEHDKWMEEISENVSEVVEMMLPDVPDTYWYRGIEEQPVVQSYTAPGVASNTVHNYAGGLLDNELYDFDDPWWMQDLPPPTQPSKTRTRMSPTVIHQSKSPQLIVCHTHPLWTLTDDIINMLVDPTGSVTWVTLAESLTSDELIQFVELMAEIGVTFNAEWRDSLSEGKDASWHKPVRFDVTKECVTGPAIRTNCTSDKLPFVLMDPFDTSGLEEDVHAEYLECEKIFKRELAKRDLVTVDQIDLTGEPIEEVYPYVCLDGTPLYITWEEGEILDEISRGNATVNELFTSDGSYIGDDDEDGDEGGDDDDERLPLIELPNGCVNIHDDIAYEAWMTVLIILKKCNSAGVHTATASLSAEIEKRFTRLTAEAAKTYMDGGKELREAIRVSRLVGYVPELVIQELLRQKEEGRRAGKWIVGDQLRDELEKLDT